MLAAAVDDGNRCHHALQLILDRNMELCHTKEGVRCLINHSGKINVGRKGRAKVQEVLEYVRKKMPSLVDEKNGRIHLGEFRTDRLLYVTSEELSDFIECVISYILILEEFRNIKNIKQ